jgi:hypothetical protein
MRRLGVLLWAVLMFTAATGSALADDGHHGDDHHGEHHSEHHPKGPPPANVAQAKLCLHDGWKSYVRADLTPFKNVAACVVYAVKGGVLTRPKSAAQVTCESFGGTFGNTPFPAPVTSVTWSCASVPYNGSVQNENTIARTCTPPDFAEAFLDDASGTTFTVWCGQLV